MSDTPPTRPEDAPPTAAEERSWLRSTTFWAIVGGVSSLITGLTTLGAVVVGVEQLTETRQLALQDAAFTSWNELSEASLNNPDLACPNTDAKLQRLLSTPDPKSTTGGTYQDRYTAYGNLVIITSEQVLQMAPKDPYWRFRIAERIRCNAPAIRFLQREGTYDRRYTCNLRALIAQTLAQPPISCEDGS